MKVYAFTGLDAVTHITHGRLQGEVQDCVGIESRRADDIASAHQCAENSREALARSEAQKSKAPDFSEARPYRRAGYLLPTIFGISTFANCLNSSFVS